MLLLTMDLSAVRHPISALTLALVRLEPRLLVPMAVSPIAAPALC